MTQKKLTSENISAIVSALAKRSGKDVDDCMLAVIHLLPRKLAESYTHDMTQAASQGDDDVNLHALTMQQLKSIARSRKLSGFMKLSKRDLITFIQTDGSKCPRFGVSKSERTNRREDLMQRIIPLFGTDVFVECVENWDILTARNLQVIARSNEYFMKGERSRLVAIKRKDLLREMLRWRKPDENEPKSPPRHHRTNIDSIL
jgi:hypothetical protein